MNPFISVWLHPKQTARYVIDHKPIWFAIVLGLVGFIATGFSVFQDSEVYPDFSYVWIFLISIFLAPLLGIVIMFIYAGVIYLMGKLLKGTGAFWDVFKASSLSYIPTIITGPLYILWMFVAPESFFFPYVTDAFAIIMSIITIVTMIWGIVISVGAIAEAHQFSIMRAIVTIIVPTILLIIFLTIIFAIIAIIFVGLFSSFV
ncbi:Yip1 family protein [Lysinibacillus sp. LZ02]|uniref:Yip1 family protein n=1 Tax=Lysinibacillus sp. LZ02 TaxID=3420668 RepID=UPI003D35CD9D